MVFATVASLRPGSSGARSRSPFLHSLNKEMLSQTMQSKVELDMFSGRGARGSQHSCLAAVWRADCAAKPAFATQ